MATSSSVSLTDWDITYPVKYASDEVYHPAYKALRYTCTYTGGLTLTRAKITIYVDGTAINTDSELLIDPVLGGTTVFDFDISEIVQNYLSTARPAIGTFTDTSQITDNASTAKVRIGVRGIYSSGGVLTEDTLRSMSSTDDIKVYNGGYDDSKIHDGTLIDTDNNGAVRKIHMSNRPTEIRARATDEIFIGFFSKSSWSTIQNYVEYFFEDGSSVGPTLTSIWSSGIPDAGYLAIGPANLAVSSNVIKYTIGLVRNSIVQKTYTVRIDKTCDDSHVQFAFLNEYGFLDYVSFNGNLIKSLGGSQNRITKPRDLAFTDNKDDNLTLTTYSIYEKKYSVISEPMREAQVEWLEEMLTSPEVYVIENGGYFPVQISNPKVTTVDKSKGIVGLEFNYTYVIGKRQRG